MAYFWVASYMIHSAKSNDMRNLQVTLQWLPTKMITHHYDRIMIVCAEGARKCLPTIMIVLWSPTIMIVRPLRIYSEQNDRIMIEICEKLTKFMKSSGLAHIATCTLQVASRHFGFFRSFFNHLKLLFEKASFHQNDRIMIVPELLKNFAH